MQTQNIVLVFRPNKTKRCQSNSENKQLQKDSGAMFFFQLS